MSNLSFAQRRHELAWRLASHSRALQHVTALTAAAGTSHVAPDACASWIRSGTDADATGEPRAEL